MKNVCTPVPTPGVVNLSGGFMGFLPLATEGGLLSTLTTDTVAESYHEVQRTLCNLWCCHRNLSYSPVIVMEGFSVV